MNYLLSFYINIFLDSYLFQNTQNCYLNIKNKSSNKYLLVLEVLFRYNELIK